MLTEASAPMMSGKATATSALLWWTTALAALWQLGAHVDAWYHLHHGFEIETFITWPHALLYGGWAGTGLVVASYVLRNVRQGAPRQEWLPPGYTLLLVGVALFGLGGLFDAAWHSLFGFEAKLEALLSPAHLALVVAYMLVVFGLLRAAAAHRARAAAPAWRPWLADVPVMLGFGLLFRVALWSLYYSEPLAVDYAAGGAIASRLWGYPSSAWGSELARVVGVTGVLLHSVLLSLFVVVPLRRLRLPGGTILTLLLWDAVLLVAVTDMWLYLPAAVGAALVGEVLWSRVWQGALGGPEGERGYWLLAFAVPFVQFALYFALMAALGGGIIWTTHLWAGTPIMAGFYGVLVALLVVPPRFLSKT